MRLLKTIVKRVLEDYSSRANGLKRCCDVGLMVVACILLTSCVGQGTNGGSASQADQTSATATPVAVAKLHWCGKPLVLFRDEGASGAPATTTGTAAAAPTPTATAGGNQTPVAVTVTPPANSAQSLQDWTRVEPLLGFTVYLPESLPANTCLMSASGTIHDPILGGSFTIGYLLPDHSALSLSEAPLRSQHAAFQCSPAPTNAAGTAGGAAASRDGTPTGTAASSAGVLNDLLCSGIRGTTNIVFAARGREGDLQRLFNNLQPHVRWLPNS